VHCRTKKQKEKKKTNKNQVIIKVFGEETPVLHALKKIEALFPVYIEGKVNRNDSDEGVHVFLTVPAETQP
jgi:hypothetical protein